MQPKQYFEKPKQELYSVLSSLRANPSSFVPKLEARLEHFKGLSYKPPGKSAFKTKDGAAAIKEAIGVLKSTTQLPKLSWNDQIAQASADHANDIGQKGVFSHKGSDGSTFADRISRYGQCRGKSGQCIDFYNTEAQEVIITLLIDDGSKQRTNRSHLLNPEFKSVGIASAKHAKATVTVVLCFAANFESKEKSHSLISTQSPQKSDTTTVDKEKLAREVLQAHNKLRQNPKSFVPKLKEKLQYFEGDKYKVPGQITIVTSEGAAAVQEAINFLNKQQSLGTLKEAEGLANAARDHASDIGPKGLETHTGTDGSKTSERIDRYGKWMGKVGENIDFTSTDADEIIMDLIIDDGNKGRGHRKNIFTPEFALAGVAVAEHKKMEYCIVIDYCSEFAEKGKANGSSNKNKKNQKSSSQISLDGLSNKQPVSQISLESDTDGKPNLKKLDFEKLAREVHDSQNRLRLDPKSFIPKLQHKLKHFDGTKLKISGEITIATAEGPTPVKEAIDTLQKQKPLSKLSWKDGIARAARDHVRDIGPKGLQQHNGTDGSKISDRLDRYGKWMGKIGENIDFCSTEADEIILDLLIDDGTAGRGHRKNLLNPDFMFSGTSIEKHAQLDLCIVIDYASEYEDKSDLKKQEKEVVIAEHERLITDPFPIPLDEAAKALPKDPEGLKTFSREIFELQNSIRMNPRSFIPKLQEDLQTFRGKELHLPGYLPITTQEGPSVYEEAIEYLEQAQPVEPLEWSDAIYQASLEHALEIGLSGSFSHSGSNGSKPADRIAKYGRWKGSVGESIDFASFTREDVLASLIVDDGNATRGHRKNIFSPKFRVGAAAAARHMEMDACIVMNFCSEFAEGEKQPQPQIMKPVEQFKLPNNAAGIASLSDKKIDLVVLKAEVFEVQNQLRREPWSLVPLLEEKLQYFDGNTLNIPGQIPLITSEGPFAVKEAIQFLKDQQPLPELSWNDGMALAAKDHAEDIGRSGAFGHTGSDGSNLSARLKRYGAWSGRTGENIEFGCDKAEEVVLSLLVDDGNAGRGHRRNLFKVDFSFTGIAVASHAEMDVCVVIDYATQFEEC